MTECLAYYQVDEKCGLQAAQKESEPRRANYKDESGNLKAEFIFRFHNSCFQKDISPFQQAARNLSSILAIQIVDFLLYLADFFGQVVHLSEIIAIGFDYQLLVILF